MVGDFNLSELRIFRSKVYLGISYIVMFLFYGKLLRLFVSSGFSLLSD